MENKNNSNNDHKKDVPRCLTCNTSFYDICNVYGGFKKFGRFKYSWYLYLFFILALASNILFGWLVWCLYKRKFCPICKNIIWKLPKYHSHLESDQKYSNYKDKDYYGDKSNDFEDLLWDVHEENYEDNRDEIFDILKDEYLDSSFMEKWIEDFFNDFNENEKNYSLVISKKRIDTFLEWIASHGYSKKISISILNWFFGELFFDNSEFDFLNVIIAYFIIKILFTKHKNFFVKKQSKWQFNGILKYIEEDIYEEVQEIKEEMKENDDDEINISKSFSLYFLSKENDINQECYFLSMFFNEDMIWETIDIIQSIKIPFNWNVNDFEEFIKIEWESKNVINEEENTFVDYYKILEINEDASMEEIKKAYRKLIAKYHPDIYKESDAHQKSIEINKAYQILSDEESKAEYDDLYFKSL